MQETRQFTVLLVGDGGVGKTAFMKRLINGNFEKRYLPTMGLDQVSYTINTTTGPIEFTVRDMAGQEKFSISPHLLPSHYEGVDATIFMFDVTSKLTYKSVNYWRNKVTSHLPNVPTITVGNKTDVTNRKVHSDQIDSSLVQYYVEISTKSCTNYEQVFLHLARQLTGDNQLRYSTQEEHYVAQTPHVVVI